MYKGFEVTVSCIEHLANSRNTNQTAFEIVVIDDYSPDSYLSTWLDEQVVALDFQLLRNDTNLGFVRTVNRGMQLSSTHDIVLLNSDAMVAGDWLDRLQRCAYREANIGTVTPFSNNAEICSYPKFCVDNQLPEGMDVHALHAIFARANDDMHVDIPTGVGFCMYIRRELLDDIGLFDADTFGRGYGEENDFCMRALEKGWRNTLACDVFVAHVGAVSFDETSNSAKQRAQKLIDDLHPTYHHLVHRFIQEDPVRDYRLRATIARLQQSDLPTILFLLHNRGGGTQKHVDEMASLLAGAANVLEIRPLEGSRITMRWLSTTEDPVISIDVDKHYDTLVGILRAIAIERIHFHHTMGLPTRLWGLPRDLNVAFDFTVHDYYAICPQISLTKEDNRYCGERGVADCQGCLRKNPAPGGVPIEVWRGNNELLLAQADRVIAPSLDVARRMARYLPSAKIIHLPHPEQGPRAQSAHGGVGVRHTADVGALRVAVLGALGPIKGADLLERCAIDARKRNLPINFRLIGYAYRHLNTYPRSNLEVHGPYDDKDLPELLRHYKIDLLWFPAQCPETYSYTLSTALKGGYPVLAPNLGAFPERLAENDNAFIYVWDADAHEINDRMLHIWREESDLADANQRSLDEEFINQGAIDLFPAEAFVQRYLEPLENKPPRETNWFYDVEIPSLTSVLPQAESVSRSRKILLDVLYRVRSTRVMRHVARAIPANVQRRVKNRILGQ